MAKTWENVRGELKIDDKDEAIVQIKIKPLSGRKKIFVSRIPYVKITS